MKIIALGSDDIIIKTSQILSELWRQIKEFKQIWYKNNCEREVFFADNIWKMKQMKIGFDNEQEIDKLRNDQTYKLNIRNTLGIKSSEDWIFNLYIGNVMHLAPLK